MSMPGMRSASAARADDGAAGRLLEAQVAAGVVAVVMGVENVREPPALGVEALQDRLGVGGVDRGGESAFRIVNEHGVIVG